jgi:hypothetical protein
MNRLITIFLSLSLIAISACAGKSEVKPRKMTTPNTEIFSSKVLDYRVVSEEDAVRLAQRHLAIKNRSWGKVVDVSEEDNRFYVMFETPKREKRLLGQRKLIVEKRNGLVKAHKRR